MWYDHYDYVICMIRRLVYSAMWVIIYWLLIVIIYWLSSSYVGYHHMLSSVINGLLLCSIINTYRSMLKPITILIILPPPPPQQPSAVAHHHHYRQHCWLAIGHPCCPGGWATCWRAYPWIASLSAKVTGRCWSWMLYKVSRWIVDTWYMIWTRSTCLLYDVIYFHSILNTTYTVSRVQL